MLIEFRVENHRSIREEQILSMTSNREQTRTRKIAAIYGANASGKSNLIAALSFMASAVLDSHRFWDAEGVPRDPFAWGNSRAHPSLYEITFSEGGIRYRYGFVVDDSRVIEEWLHVWPRKRKQVWFERDGDKYKFGENLKGENRVVEEVTRENALFLSTATQLRHTQLRTIYRWFRKVRVISAGSRVYRRRSSRIFTGGLHPLSWISQAFSDQLELPTISDDARVNSAKLILSLLKTADIGIIDVKIRRQTEERRSILDSILFLHENEGQRADAWLPLREESAGTQKLLELARPVFSALMSGSLLVVDELERSLHPLLAAFLVQQFASEQTNKNGAQLIFTTHDTHLLGTQRDGEHLLTREDVWLTEKSRTGATVLYPLSDYRPRKGENLERGYLQGRYGSIPFLGDLLNSGERNEA